MSTVILEIVRVGASQRNDLRAPASLCACRCTRSRSHRTQPCKHARTHTETCVRGFHGGATKRMLLRNNSCHGERYRQHTRATPDFNGHRHVEKGNKGSARPLDLAREKRELLLHFSERFTTTLCRASFVRRLFRVAAWKFKMKATSRRHNLADDNETCAGFLSVLMLRDIFARREYFSSVSTLQKCKT